MVPKHLKLSRTLGYLFTMERFALVLDVKVSPLAQSIPKRAQISPE